MMLRPRLAEFLSYLIAKFAVAIWSSMTYQNVQNLRRLISAETGLDENEFYFVYDQWQCFVHLTETNPTKANVPLYVKDYDRIELPIEPFNTLLIDDTPSKAMYNPHYTCISPIPFEGDPSDNFVVGQLKPWLQGMENYSGTIQDYVQENPFN